jgi:hypothetical protein
MNWPYVNDCGSQCKNNVLTIGKKLFKTLILERPQKEQPGRERLRRVPRDTAGK